MSHPEEPWRALLGDDVVTQQLGALWGKSPRYAGGTTNLLLQHLFDTMTVAELIWDRYLAAGFRHRLDRLHEGQGRRLYVWLCGLHDVGKASPPFQRQDRDLADRVRRVGLTTPQQIRPADAWRHERVGALVLRELLHDAWPDGGEQVDWVWPMVAGHHGIFPPGGDVFLRRRDRERRRAVRGGQPWLTVQDLLVRIVTAAAGWPDLLSTCPSAMPSRADQLALAGLISMADWIASDGEDFPGKDRLDQVGIRAAAERAAQAWNRLGLRGGWGNHGLSLATDIFATRFGRSPRPAQQMVIDAARAMVEPGIMVIEAPMGEGKTEAALAAAEILAARFGADGVYIALPTQATSDAMFERAEAWLRTFDDPPPVALLHGRRRIAELARRGGSGDRRPSTIGGDEDVDEYGLPLDVPSFGGICEDLGPDDDEPPQPAEWFLGRYRGLLTANAVGTIDQALYAATRTKFVALRYAGLAGKVVIFDEIHAVDAYMNRFLGEALRWLGSGGVPVILLSATLAPAQRNELVEAYLTGAGSTDGLSTLDPAQGYPRLLTASVGSEVSCEVRTAPAWRPSQTVKVSVLPEDQSEDPSAVADLLRFRLGDGGCALVIRNTVRRAQDLYRELLPHLGEDLVLLHSRFVSSERARRTDRLLRSLGPDGASRPNRLVVVATQVAEQSFDVDADLLVTDLAPIDLLLQRVGRVHRHERPTDRRPRGLREPEVVVTGIRFRHEAPWFPPGSAHVYATHLLLRSAAFVDRAAQGAGWMIPSEIPDLVAEGYGDTVVLPETWQATAREAQQQWEQKDRQLRSQASPYLLSPSDRVSAPTLQGLHTLAQGAEGQVNVRDGEMGEEVVLLVHDDRGWHTVDGVSLGVNGDGGRDRPADVLGSSLRLPTERGLAEAVAGLSTLPAWHDDPWLRGAQVVELDAAGRGQLGRHFVAYQPDLGLDIGQHDDR